MKRLFIMFLLVLTMLSMSSCNFQYKSDASTFDEYSYSVFQTLFMGDELSMNFYFENPENFNLEHSDTLSLPTPGKASLLSLLFFNFSFGAIKTYDYNELNFDQKMTYNVICDLVDKTNSRTPDFDYLSSDYLGSYLGYQAQLPLLLMRYNLRNKTDVDNYFKLIDLIPETFKKYVSFEEEKADHGYGMPNFVINKVIAQCESFLKNIDSDTEYHFMITTMNDRIDKLEFLTTEEKDSYKALNISKVRGPMAEGYRYIKDNLPNYLDRATNNLGLAHYVDSEGKEIGKQYYQYAFNDATGYNDSVEDAIKYIDSKLASFEEKLAYYKDLAVTNPTFKTEVSSAQFMTKSIEEQLAYYQTVIKGIYPTIDDSYTINIEYVAEAMEDYFSPAAYMISPIDSHENEFIYLNRSSIYTTKLNTETNEVEEVLDYNYLFTTLAHEGIPGHLYQNVYFKNKDVNILRKALRSSGYLEGWAVFSEHFIYEALKNDPTNTTSNDVIDYYSFQDDFGGAIQSRLDLGIHYEGWTEQQAYEFLSKYYDITLEKATEAFQRLVEVPTNSQTYYYTYFKLCDLLEYAKSVAKEEFDLLTFNTLVLGCGPVPLRFVDEYVRNYYNDKYLNEPIS